MSRLSERLSKLETVLTRVELLLEKHEKAMIGNGSPGCFVRIDRLEKVADTNVKNISNIFRSLSKIQKTIWVAMGCGMTITALFSNSSIFLSLISLLERR